MIAHVQKQLTPLCRRHPQPDQHVQCCALHKRHPLVGIGLPSPEASAFILVIKFRPCRTQPFVVLNYLHVSSRPVATLEPRHFVEENENRMSLGYGGAVLTCSNSFSFLYLPF